MVGIRKISSETFVHNFICCNQGILILEILETALVPSNGFLPFNATSD